MIKRQSYFKNPPNDRLFLENWVKNLEKNNHRTYTNIKIKTALGNTKAINYIGRKIIKGSDVLKASDP